MGHFPACIEGDSIALVETIGDDASGVSGHVKTIDLVWELWFGSKRVQETITAKVRNDKESTTPFRETIFG